jgi:hypothetical protein
MVPSPRNNPRASTLAGAYGGEKERRKGGSRLRLSAATEPTSSSIFGDLGSGSGQKETTRQDKRGVVVQNSCNGQWSAVVEVTWSGPCDKSETLDPCVSPADEAAADPPVVPSRDPQPAHFGSVEQPLQQIASAANHEAC